MKLKFLLLLFSCAILLSLIIPSQPTKAQSSDTETLAVSHLSAEELSKQIVKSDWLKSSLPQTCTTTTQTGNYPTYGPAVNLVEKLANGSQVELAPAYPPAGYFIFYSLLKEGDTYYLWSNSLQYNGPNYQSKEQRLESQDGLVWHNRSDTNL